jgi:hypothetical protein
MSRSIYDKQLVRWVKSHHWDSLEKDKDIILRHIRTFAGGDVEQENAEALNPSHNTGSPKLPTWSEVSSACGVPQFPDTPPLHCQQTMSKAVYDYMCRQLRASA